MVVRSCPTSKRVVWWYGKNCMLRYSDESFFSIVQYLPDFIETMLSIQPVPKVNATLSDEPTGFNHVMKSILNDLVTEISKAPSKFATKEAHVAGSNILRCTALRSARRTSPLQIAIPVLGYKTVPFYGKPPVHHLHLRPPPQGNRVDDINIHIYISACHVAVTQNGYEKSYLKSTLGIKSKRILGKLIVASIVASVTVCAVLVAIGCYFPGRRRSPQNKHKVQGEEKNGKRKKETIKFSRSLVLLCFPINDIAAVESLQLDLETIETAQTSFLIVISLVKADLVKFSSIESKKREQLNWSRRCMIIGGIARGILYLHEDSRLRVIHRDLKPSNILLDVNMKPKISDFGMERMFGVDDQTEGNTRGIVGTYGYMTPKYAMGGFYSIKSDVFSFGILLLEIVTGGRNFLGFHLTDTAATLSVHMCYFYILDRMQAWQLWNEGKVLELMDPFTDEFSRYIHIGLLCVQQDANHRPTMSSVALMLKTETISLSEP
ncbi:hypothetical protein DVH24_005319 [Malus domestica]|uniref:Protein kinase domain-containing protein n=1 Tax=Malus domestica TaxID=3750 RepID=A0A498KJF2_MALDO|nr:hypothetical protein DVH24_005319 [Malus domestica]